jgi:hypothetical protein
MVAGKNDIEIGISHGLVDTEEEVFKEEHLSIFWPVNKVIKQTLL